MKVKELFESKRRKAKNDLDTEIQVTMDLIKIEQKLLSDATEAMNQKWVEVGFGQTASDDDITILDVMSQEVDRRTRHIHDLLRQLETEKTLREKSKIGIEPDTVFKGLVSVATVCLVLYAEESRPIISKAMGFVIKPRL